MGRLIDVDEVKKKYPLMENDFGMVINERLHKELDKIPTVEAIPKAEVIKILRDIAIVYEKYRHDKMNCWSIGDVGANIYAHINALEE